MEQLSRESEQAAFQRTVLDVQAAFHDWFAAKVENGKVVDKQKLEQDKLKITARLVNLVVAGGILMFRNEDAPGIDAVKDATDESGLYENTFFRMLRGTLFTTLMELNAPDVNLLKVSLSARFRRKLQEVFTVPERPDRFPVKIVQDIHPDHTVYLGINLRNTCNLGEDIDRIERDPLLWSEIAERRRPVRHSDSSLSRLFQSPARLHK